MEARALIIEEKVKVDLGVVRPSDFRVRDAGAIDPQILLQNPNVTLYCLDFENRQALFVETPSECDLSRAPFLYQAQFEAAHRLIQIPYATMHRLADEIVIDPSRLILIYSVGRCGSTLVSRAFNEIKGVDSLSEPDVFTQMLSVWGADGLAGDEQTALLKSCTLLQCAAGHSKGATAWALKFRSWVTEMGPLFYSVFPEAKVVFLYRNAEPWARSLLRTIQVADPATPAPLAGMRALFGRAIPFDESRETVSFLELTARMWLTTMEKCLEMQRRGIPMFIARYEELNAAPRNVLTQLFAYCGLSANAVNNLDAVLEQDSQAGSPLSRAVGAGARIHLSPEHLAEMDQIICEGSQGLTKDTILPGTYFPESPRE